MKPSRLSMAAIGLHYLTSLWGTSNWAMEEDDIKKTALRAKSSGLYEFIHIPFGLSNAGSCFCFLMEQCLGDQQFVTLLL